MILYSFIHLFMRENPLGLPLSGMVVWYYVMVTKTPKKKLRPALPFSIQDLWAGDTSDAVKEKLEAARQELEEHESGQLETGTAVQEE